MQYNHLQFFVKNILAWNSYQNTRQMPWKSERNPYKIWLSEIMLQQTRVEQGLNYFEKFVKNFPTISDLATANEEKVFKLWEGLGYYSRCRNLIYTAKYIHEHLNGNFPKTYKEILALKGVGPYTAAAIVSFAYDLPHAVVDGNVFRVLSRYFGIHTPIDSTEGKKAFELLAHNLLDKKSPAIYNQAIMDFGATVCKPKIPLCAQCTLQINCQAYANQEVSLLPIKEKKLLKKNRQFFYVIAQYKNRYYIRKRVEKDIWQNLHEYILVEPNKTMEIDQFISEKLPEVFGHSKFSITGISHKYAQQLTHQHITGFFIEVKLQKVPALNGYFLATEAQIMELAFPKFINSYKQEMTAKT